MPPKNMFGPAAAAAALLILATAGGGARDGTASVLRVQQVSATRAVTVVAAGDMAAHPERLRRRADPGRPPPRGSRVLDAVRRVGRRAVRRRGPGRLPERVRRTWGTLKAISHPVPGDHNYHDRGAARYFTYFRQQTSPPGYYAFD